MKNNRREFLKNSSLAGISLASMGILSGCVNSKDGTKEINNGSLGSGRGSQSFNMSGYTAPKMEKVRVAFIGLGNRGPTHLKNVSLLEGVDIKALCDLVPENIDTAKKLLEDCSHNPEVYVDGEEEWKKLCRRDDVDLIYIATPWELHVPMAVYAMEQGKHVAIEVPAPRQSRNAGNW